MKSGAREKRKDLRSSTDTWRTEIYSDGRTDAEEREITTTEKTLLLTFRDELHVVVKVGCEVGLFL